MKLKSKFMINKKELCCILVNLMTVKLFFTYPRNIVINAGNAAWIQTIYVSLLAVAAYFITIRVYEKAGMKSILDISEEVGKKPLKIIVGLILIIIFTANVTVTMRSFPESVKNTLLPLTPMEVITTMLAAAIAVAAFAGIFSLSRIHSIYIPFAGIILVILLIMLTPYMNIVNIAPLFGKGTYNILLSGLEGLSIFSDILVLFVLIPFCKSFNEVKKGGGYAVIISAVVSCVLVFFYNMIYANPVAQEFIFPVYQMTRLIRIGEFFQRLDAFFEFIWSIAMMLYAGVYLYVICYIFKSVFNLKYTKELIIPFVIIISCISFIPSSIVDLLRSGTILYRISIPFCILLPVGLAVLYRIKGHKNV